MQALLLNFRHQGKKAIEKVARNGAEHCPKWNEQRGLGTSKQCAE
jgi:hypothetical protein